MKYFILFYLSIIPLFSEEQINIEYLLEQENNRNEILELKSEISILTDQIHELRKIIEHNNMNSYNNIFSHWFNIQLIFIGLLGGLSLLLPLLTYLFGYKPAKDAEERLKSLESNFEIIVKKRLEKYIIEKDTNEMIIAIDNLLLKNQELVTTAINFINYNPNVQIGDFERKKVCEALINPSISDQIKLPLKLIITNKKSIWADLYFDFIVSDEENFKKESFLLQNIYY